ncbi:MAG: efflux RND transporter periplasmic adaptor subunit [Puniceicoccales bacterium]|jgi:membrane fusion protein (multidrug efflux system)|nr:efflux RND transporter periplasmic adaptor subunit [Puniceicoccales bacterium]
MQSLGDVTKIFFIISFTLLTGCGKKKLETQKGRPPVPVVVSKCVRQDMPVSIATIGRCRAYNEVDIVTQVSGEILSIDFEEGAFVSQGQPLFHIDDRKYRASLQSSEAELARARAQLSIDELQLERSKSLMNKDYISKQEFETYSTRVEQDKANVAAAEAAIIRAKVDLEHCSIQAPISGVIGKRLMDRGAVVDTMKKLVTIRQMSPLYVDFFVSENDFPKLREKFQNKNNQLNLNMKLIAHKDTTRKGVLKFLDNKIDYESGVIQLRGEFENTDYRFWPGNTVGIDVELEILKDALVVSSESIKVNNMGKPYLYQIKPDEASVTKHRAVQIFPELGFRSELLSVIQSGLNGGDMVVVRGNMLLGPGSDVIPIPEASDSMPGNLSQQSSTSQQNTMKE